MRTRRKRRRRSGAAGIAGLMVVLLAVVISLILLFGRVFVVRRIEIRGNSAVSANEILERSGILRGESIFRVREQSVIDAFVYDGRLSVQRVETHMPDTVLITVRERVPRACVSYLGMAITIDGEATVIKQDAALPDDALIVVTGMQLTSIVEGQPLISSVAGQIEAMVGVLDAVQQAGAQTTLSEINLENLDMMYALTVGGMHVVLGDPDNMLAKLAWMLSTLEDLARDGVTTGTLDVSGGNAAFYSGGA